MTSQHHPAGTLVTLAGDPRVYRVLSTRRSALAGWQHELHPVTGGITIYRFGEALTPALPAPAPTAPVPRNPTRLGIIQGGKPQ